LTITNTSTTNGGLMIGVSSTEEAFFWNGSNTSMNFATNNGEALRITKEGYIRLAGTISGSSNHLGRFLMPSHDSGEEDVMYMQMQQENTFNQLEFGGGSSSYNAATQILFRTAAIDTVTGTERLRIASDGKITTSYQLVNASAPDFPFEITQVDPSNTVNQLGGSGVGLVFKPATNSIAKIGAGIAAIKPGENDDETDSDLAFYVSQNDETLDEKLRIDHDGHVTPRATSGTQNLGTGGNKWNAIYGNTLSLSSYASVGSIVASDPGSSYYAYNNRIGSGLAIVGTTRMFGNVGINSGTPGAQLVVRASTDDNPALQLFRASTGGDIASIVWQTNAGTQAKINYRGAAGANEGLQFYTAGGGSSQMRMVVDLNGDVGIGTDVARSQLHVRGGGGLRIDPGSPVSNQSYLSTHAGDPIISGTPWYTTSTYNYDTGQSPSMDYWWIKIVENVGNSAIGYIEYLAHGDSNYPRSVHGFVDVAKYAGSSMSISHSQTTQEAGTVQCVVDSNQDVWLRFHGYDWNSDMRFRLIYGESVTLNSDFSVSGTSGGRIRPNVGSPPNASFDIKPGMTMRWDLSNSNPPQSQAGGTSSQTANQYGVNNDYSGVARRMGKAYFGGRVDMEADWNNNALTVHSNGIDVNGSSQPITATFKSQKNTVAEFNRMYDQGVILQFRQNNDARGYINNSGTTTTLVQSGSDERLKKNFEDWTEEVLPHFKSLKPKKFNFKEESDDAKKTKGYIAQDNLEAFPEAYPLNPNDDRYWFANSEMVPYLMKALQEEIVKREEIEAKYNALEARITALESP